MTPIHIMLGARHLNGSLWDNPAARSFLEQLPITLMFKDYGGQEVLAASPQPLNIVGMPSGQSAPAGTIGYYAPAESIVLYYSDVPRYPGIIRIGRIDGDVSVLRGWEEARAITVKRVR